ncbi:MAG: Rid family detoxifying hydrolase [Pseudomonadota bacterium]
MTNQTVHTPQAPAAIGPYSQAIISGHHVFVSGQLGMEPASGNLVGPALADQARQALANLKQIVLAAGSAMDRVVAVDVFLTDMGDFIEFNGIYAEAFGDHKPARAVVAVAGLPKGACVEIKCIATLA